MMHNTHTQKQTHTRTHKTTTTLETDGLRSPRPKRRREDTKTNERRRPNNTTDSSVNRVTDEDHLKKGFRMAQRALSKLV